MDQRLEKWTRWVDGPIKADILTMHLQRDAWQKVSAMLDARQNELPASYWWEFMHDTYATTQAVAVRRQADLHRDVASLGKLIDQIREDPARVTREHWLSLWGVQHQVARWDSERAWSLQYGGTVGGHLDPAIPTADLAALRVAATDVKAYVDQFVAHFDANAAPASLTLTLKEVHAAIDVLGDLFKRYYNLLTASSWAVLVPAIQHDWMAVFRHAWMPSGYAMPD